MSSPRPQTPPGVARPVDAADAARPRVPVSTYRLQVHAGFPLDAAADIVPYLDALGVTDAYTSPLLAAVTGSGHGYDVTDPEVVSPDAGGAEALARFHTVLRERRMGHLLDIVPNHMAAAEDNLWWADVLTHGPASPFAATFDIDWDTPPRPADRGRVVLPALGEPSASAADHGHIRLEFDERGAAVRVYSRRLPLDPRTLPLVFADPPAGELGAIVRAAGELPPRTDPAGHAAAEDVARRLAELFASDKPAWDAAADAARAATADPAHLDRVLATQAYRLTHWKAGADEVNYRRFFDVADLVALRADRPDVFAATHQLVVDWCAAGGVTGLRIDHPDGLADPADYLVRLRDAVKRRTGRVPYVVVEKILAPGEPLRPDWACHGAAGYEFIAAVTGLLVDPAGETGLTACYEAFTGRTEPVADLVDRSKKLLLDTSFGGDLGRVADLLFAVATKHRRGRDYTRAELSAAVRELAANFPAYRSYVVDVPAAADRTLIGRAVAAATGRLPTHAAAVRFAELNLLLAMPDAADVAPAELPAVRAAQAEFARRFQQLTAPATAKGFEDTTLYRYFRLLALNEVGGDPAQFGVPPGEVHDFLRDRPRGSLSPLSTHDTKRGEDARARLCVLSEVPAEWAAAVDRWAGQTAAHQVTLADGRAAPDRNTEYLLYQALLGTWPADPAERESLPARLREFAVKAMREGKDVSGWRNPDPAFEAGVCDWLTAILDPARSPEFLADFAAFAARIQRPAALNTLAQTLLRVAAPGVPDTYQGSDLGDYSLVDPDNRRPVDYQRRRAMLADLDARAAADLPGLAAELAADPADPRAKLFVLSRGLRFRRHRPTLFADGDHTPLAATGPAADSAFAFLREYDGVAVLAAVPRLTARMAGGDPWAGTTLPLPPEWAGKTWTCAFTGVRFDPAPAVDCAELFGRFPVTLLAGD